MDAYVWVHTQMGSVVLLGFLLFWKYYAKDGQIQLYWCPFSSNIHQNSSFSTPHSNQHSNTEALNLILSPTKIKGIRKRLDF